MNLSFSYHLHPFYCYCTLVLANEGLGSKNALSFFCFRTRASCWFLVLGEVMTLLLLLPWNATGETTSLSASINPFIFWSSSSTGVVDRSMILLAEMGLLAAVVRFCVFAAVLLVLKISELSLFTWNFAISCGLNVHCTRDFSNSTSALCRSCTPT